MQNSSHWIKLNPLRIFLIVVLVLAFLLVQSAAWTSVYAQNELTPTPTETRIRLVSSGGYCGPNLAKLNLSLQRQVISATRSVKGALCGRLVILHDEKSKKDLIGLKPCNGGGPYIFDTRPRELLNYYQLINVKFRNGKTIRVEGYGDLSRYILNFETYYPMVDCSGCGYLPGYQPVSTQSQFIFPGSSPSSTPAPFLSQAQLGSGALLGSSSGGLNFSSEFVFPTPTSAFNMADSDLVVVSTPSPTRVIPPLQTTAPPPTHTPSPTPLPVVSKSLASTSDPAGITGLINNTKPPAPQPPFGVLGYSLYTFLLVPPIVFWILWRRARLV